MLVKEINRLINSIMSSRSSDNMYLGITFGGGAGGTQVRQTRSNGQVQKSSRAQ